MAEMAGKSLDDLDVDLVCTAVLRALPPSSILTISRLNHKWRDLFVTKQNLLWKTLCLKFGITEIPDGQTSWKNFYLSLRNKALLIVFSGDARFYLVEAQAQLAGAQPTLTVPQFDANITECIEKMYELAQKASTICVWHNTAAPKGVDDAFATFLLKQVQDGKTVVMPTRRVYPSEDHPWRTGKFEPLQPKGSVPPFTATDWPLVKPEGKKHSINQHYLRLTSNTMDADTYKTFMLSQSIAVGPEVHIMATWTKSQLPLVGEHVVPGGATVISLNLRPTLGFLDNTRTLLESVLAYASECSRPERQWPRLFEVKKTTDMKANAQSAFSFWNTSKATAPTLQSKVKAAK